jgi:putative tricarboxylic transport membrane protein
MTRLDRWLGAFLVLAGIAIAGTARGFTVGFMVDPLGPKALPFLVAGLFGLGGGALLLRRKPLGDPGLVEPTEPSKSKLGLQATSVGVLLLLAGLIIPFGFIPPTILATAALARLFGGRWISGLAVGLALALGLFGLFTLGFGLDLPMGELFGGGP